MNLSKRIKNLEERVDSMVNRSITKSRLHYCSVRNCLYCKHETLQSALRLQGDSEDAHTCLTCGKTWHKSTKIIEFTG